MKLELKENMYVRTKDGRMGKLMGCSATYKNKIAIWTNTTEEGIKITPVIDKDTIVKASYNIIDILEVGDYVNEQKIYYDEELDYLYVQCIDGDGNLYYESITKQSFIDNIKSIVTKEQMEQIAYKVGE